MANVVAASARPQDTVAFLSAIADPQVSDADLARLRPAAFETLDAETCGSTLRVLTAKVNEDTSRIMVTIQQPVQGPVARRSVRWTRAS